MMYLFKTFVSLLYGHASYTKCVGLVLAVNSKCANITLELCNPYRTSFWEVRNVDS